jgi:hypothetical protein
MPKHSELTDQQQKNHAAAMKKMGMDPASAPKTLLIDKRQELHPDAARSAVKGHKVVVRDLAQLKDLGGVPDSRYTSEGQPDSHIRYPEPLPADRKRLLAKAGDSDSLHAALTPEERQAVGDSMSAYVLGNSAKVHKEFVDLAAVANFPMEVTVYAADDLRITDKMIFKGPTPQKLVAGTITIVKPNGQIIAECPLSIEAQHIVVEHA